MFKHTLIAFALTAGMTTVAFAQQDNIDVAATANTRTASINTADLNLATAAGKATLHARVKLAVNEVCNFGASRFDVDTACAADAAREGAAQATAAAAAAKDGRVAQSSIVLHGAK